MRNEKEMKRWKLCKEGMELKVIVKEEKRKEESEKARGRERQNADRYKIRLLFMTGNILYIYIYTGACGAMVIVRENGHGKSWARSFAFHIALILLEKVCIQIFHSSLTLV